MSTLANNTKAQEAVSQSIMDTLERIYKRIDSREVIQTQFRCMEGYAALPKSIIKDYLTDAALDDTSTGTGSIGFSGEIFSQEELKPLYDIRTKVNSTMQKFGVLIGTAGSFVIDVKQHDKVISFLEDMKQAYQSHLSSLLQNYDSIIANHKIKLEQEIKNENVVKSLIAKFPTMEELERRNKCSYQIFTTKKPSIDEVKSDSLTLLSTVDGLKDQDIAFIGKITEPFKAFAKSLEDSDKKSLQHKPSMFKRTVDTVLSEEGSLMAILAGSEFEYDISKAFELVHRLKDKLCVELSASEKKAYTQILLDKYQVAAYVLSSSERISDYVAGKIEVIDDTFNLKGELAFMQTCETTLVDSDPVMSHAQATEVEENEAINDFLQERFNANIAAKAQTQVIQPQSASMFSEDLFDMLDAEVRTASKVESVKANISNDIAPTVAKVDVPTVPSTDAPQLVDAVDTVDANNATAVNESENSLISAQASFEAILSGSPLLHKEEEKKLDISDAIKALGDLSSDSKDVSDYVITSFDPSAYQY